MFNTFRAFSESLSVLLGKKNIPQDEQDTKQIIP